MTMSKLLSGLTLTLLLMLLGPVPAPAASFGATGSEERPIILAAGPEEALPVGEILHMETDHLLAWGVGLVVGATVISPYLEVSELTGVAIGVISGDLLYRSGLWPFQKRSGWFD